VSKRNNYRTRSAWCSSPTDKQIIQTLSVGGEYAINSNWSLKAEYLYVDLGTFNYNSPLVAAVPAFAPGYSWRTSINERDHIARVGVNYRWGNPLVAKY
jgi:outer membrane immunogenic protein